MANAFTVSKSFRYGDRAGFSRVVFEGILAIDTTATGGAVAGDLPASMFNGLRQITRVHALVNDANDKVYPAAPSYDGSSLMVGGGASNAPQDLPNDNYYLTIEGIK